MCPITIRLCLEENQISPIEFRQNQIPAKEKKITVVLAERIDQHLRHLEPPHVEEELEEGEDWDVEVHLVPLVALRDVQELAAHQGGEKKCVDGECDNLGVDQGDGDPGEEDVRHLMRVSLTNQS